MSAVGITHIGGPTVLIEYDGWTILTDPTFDAPGRTYGFGWGTKSTKLRGPAIEVDDLPPIDLVLLSHDQHADNLDRLGRRLLAEAGQVFTTRAAAKRLGGRARGMRRWETIRLTMAGKPDLTVTATPARHGPPLTTPIVGQATGFDLSWEGQEHGSLWITGDTVLSGGVLGVGSRANIGTVIMHLGRVQFGISGPLNYTMGSSDAVKLVEAVDPVTVLPVHYEGWSHFREGRAEIEAAFSSRPEVLRFLTLGSREMVTV